MFKVNLQRAFRNLRIDPANYHLLGLSWRHQTYVDVAMPFGFRQGASSFQICTDAIVYLMWSQKFWVMAYQDNIVGVVHPHQANNAFLTITHLLQHLGLSSNEKKVEPPSHKIVCLGIEIDAKRGTLSIPVDKLQKITKKCHVWLHKHRAIRHQVQRLVGHLIYIHKCIPPARLFVN